MDKLPRICGVAFVKKSYFKNGIVIAHEGYVINNKNLIHASSKEKMTVLHCSTEYPTPLKNVNLRAMDTIKEKFKVKKF